MNYANSRELEVTEPPKLKVFSLNTGLSGRQVFTEVDPSLTPSWRFVRILDFIHRESPDVILLQEVYKNDLEKYSNALGGRMVFSPMCRLSLTDRIEDAEGWGVAIGSRYALSDTKEDYYHGVKEDSGNVVLNNGLQSTSSLLQAKFEVGSARFNFGTTHFTWHNRAEPSDEQLEDFKKLAVILDKTPDIVLTGDFNSPRGYPIFDSIAERYRDNIPATVETTTDTTIRPDATWRLVIDGFFTSQHYRVRKVSLVKGLSDHQGVLGEVFKSY